MHLGHGVLSMNPLRIYSKLTSNAFFPLQSHPRFQAYSRNHIQSLTRTGFNPGRHNKRLWICLSLQGDYGSGCGNNSDGNGNNGSRNGGNGGFNYWNNNGDNNRFMGKQMACILAVFLVNLYVISQAFANMEDGSSTGETSQQIFKRVIGKPGDLRDDIRTIKRLLREIFADIFSLKQRLEQVSLLSRQDTYDSGQGVSQVGEWRRIQKYKKAPLKYFSKILVGTFGLLTDGKDKNTNQALQSVDFKTGPSFQLELESQLPNDGGVVESRIQMDFHSGKVTLNSLLYKSSARNSFQFVLAPLGGKLRSVVPDLHPCPDIGLSSILSDGSILHSQVHQHGIGVNYAQRDFDMGIAQFWNSYKQGLESNTMIQVTASPFEQISLGLLQSMKHYSPLRLATPVEPTNGADVLDYESGLNFRGIVGPVSRQSNHQRVVSLSPWIQDQGAEAGLAYESAIIGSVNFGEMLISSWLGSGGGFMNIHPESWGFIVGTKPDDFGVTFQLGAGQEYRNRRENQYHKVTQMEASLQFPVNDGVKVCAGITAGVNEQGSSVGIGMQSTWHF